MNPLTSLQYFALGLASRPLCLVEADDAVEAQGAAVRETEMHQPEVSAKSAASRQVVSLGFTCRKYGTCGAGVRYFLR